jgi:hypothetical protein
MTSNDEQRQAMASNGKQLVTSNGDEDENNWQEEYKMDLVRQVAVTAAERPVSEVMAELLSGKTRSEQLNMLQQIIGRGLEMDE